MNRGHQYHDGNRCPECETRGTIDEFRTRENPPNEHERVRGRIYECPDCEARWLSLA